MVYFQRHKKISFSSKEGKKPQLGEKIKGINRITFAKQTTKGCDRMHSIIR
jgi:hypothetical protein